MRKIVVAIILCALLAACMCAFTACGAPSYDALPSSDRADYSADALSEELKAFLVTEDRTGMVKADEPEDGDGEYLAAEYLAARIAELTADEAGEARGKTDVVRFDGKLYDDTFASQNVIYSLEAPEENNPEGYRIVIGAHYDNMYKTVRSANGRLTYFGGTGAEGAVGNGAAVAVLLRMCAYFAAHAEELTVDVDFAFYGMGCLGYIGAQEYYEGLGESGREKLVLAVTLERLCGDELFLYFDEQSTPHGEFIMGVAAKEGYGGYVSEPPAAQADPDVVVTDKLPYTPYGLMNESAVFFGNSNICSVTSGTGSTFLLFNGESADREDVAYTSSDTLDTLERECADYAERISVAAEVLTDAVYCEGFAEACAAGAESVRSYAWLTNRIAAYAVAAALAAGLLVFTVLMSRRMRKKYVEENKDKKIKVAVFGMDYEEPEDGDVYVDIGGSGGQETPPEPEDPFGDDPFGDGK